MIHALVLAALSTCGDAGAQLQNAQTLLTHAQAMIDAKQPGAAEPYHQAAQILGAVPSTATGACDKHEYEITLLVSRLRSLAVATEVNELRPLEAHAQDVALESDYDEAHIESFGARSNMDAIRWRLSEAMKKNVPAELLQSAHNPASGSCEIREIRVEPKEIVTPDYPIAARDALSEATTVVVRVRVNANGTVSGTSVAKSSYVPSLDAAASAAAAATVYFPAVKDCVRVPSSFLFRVTFDPNG